MLLVSARQNIFGSASIMKWHKLALNPQSLDSLYENVPELENVELFSFNLHREGSRIQICFDLPSFPDYPPARWEKSFNTAQIQLSFYGVTNFKAQEWQENMKIMIEIKRDEKVLVVVSNPQIDLRFSFSCDLLRIESITPYKNN